MKSLNRRLILILSSFALLFLFQNFDTVEFPDPALGVSRTFASIAQNQEGFIKDFAEYQLGFSPEQRGEELWQKYGLEFRLNEFENQKLQSDKIVQGEQELRPENKMKFSVLNIDTLKYANNQHELKAKLSPSDVKLTWKTKASASRDYVVEHDVKENQSAMKMEWRW